ncbi:hypothetical protein B0I37DRAFT_448126 [Chaetomium sp. MPI-CAGE-AT-0009]|nr:hypothetical protein B0I37DRAFT_448126 [Chaetomium sp. MPI-CAGE-AT-0009]
MSKRRSIGPSSDTRHLDVQSWLPEPSDVSSLGLAGSLCEAILNLFIPLTRHIIREARVLDPESSLSSFSREVERFFLWCQGFSAGNGHLDDILSKSQELRFCILTALYGLGSSIRDGVARFLSEESWAKDPARDLQGLLEQTVIALGLSELEALEDEGEEGDVDESAADLSADEMEVDDFTSVITTYIDCLMDSSTALQSPVVDIDLSGAAQTHLSLETFEVSSPQASAFCRKIRDRFPKLAKWLVERLGEGNACRASILKDLRADRLEIVVANPEAAKDGAESDDSITPSEALFSDSQPKVTDTTRSTFQSDSIFDRSQAGSSSMAPPTHPVPRSPKRVVNLDPGDDVSSMGSADVSFATFSSFSTVSALKGGRPRVPPLPDEANQGGPFVCYICNQSMAEGLTRSTWKRHVFADLCPYVCTLPGCETASKLFQSSGAWAKHESSHRSEPRCFSACPFCEIRLPDGSAMAYKKHVAEHLREISLAALPQFMDPDSTLADDSDSSEDGASGEDDNRTEDGWDVLEMVPPQAKPGLDADELSGWETDHQTDQQTDRRTESSTKGSKAARAWRPDTSLASPGLDLVDVLMEPPTRLTKKQFRFVNSSLRKRRTAKMIKGRDKQPTMEKNSRTAASESGASQEDNPPSLREEGYAETKRVKTETTHEPSLAAPLYALFLSYVNKGPDSERGLSWNKVLKRFHRERSAALDGVRHSKDLTERELWRQLRMKQNDRGEVILFAVDENKEMGATNPSQTDVVDDKGEGGPDDEGEAMLLGSETKIKEGEEVTGNAPLTEDAGGGGDRGPKDVEGLPTGTSETDEAGGRGGEFAEEKGSGGPR